MRASLILFFISLSSFVNGQITASTVNHDFGDIYSDSQTYVDIVFTNNSQANQFLLTIEKPRDVYYIFSSKKMLADSSIVIRFKINDALKGKFFYQVDIYFSGSADPVTISLKGNVHEPSSTTSMTDCPDFNSKPPTGSQNFSLVIKVVDSITHEPIPNAQVYLVERGELIGNYTTNQKGIVIKNVPLGFYFITAEKDPYTSNYYEGYVNASRNYVEIELSNGPRREEYFEEPDVVVYENEPMRDTVPDEIVILEPDPIVETDPDPILETDPVIDEVPVIIPPLTEIPDSLLDPRYFKYSNITFILDASSSMNASGKMDLMKMSMIELVKILRPEDNITILKYAAETQLVLDHTSGDKKEEIILSIKGIKTSGSTAGGDAIKTAYAMNYEKYVQGGNNLVIIITDGLFNKGATDYAATIENNYIKYGTIFSVVGIKTTELVAQHMKGVVAKGGGDFIQINSIHDAQTKLISEIRRTAYKG
jgi:Ca-activated chloride channel family protein